MQPDNATGSSGDREDLQRRGISWLAMLGWIALAFVLAALVAYRLVTPFFHRGG